MTFTLFFYLATVKERKKKKKKKKLTKQRYIARTPNHGPLMFNALTEKVENLIENLISYASFIIFSIRF